MGATILHKPFIEKKVEYELVFDDGKGNGYGFLCDRKGNILAKYEEAKIQYKECMAHPERFLIFNSLEQNITKIHHGAVIRCICGEVMELYDKYHGACDCEKCHQWYNLLGQSLVDPEHWLFDDDYDDWDSEQDDDLHF